MSCEKCGCSGSFVRGPNTKDGKSTWRPVCNGGLVGGCLTSDEVTLQLRGAQKGTAPIQFFNTGGFRHPLTGSWRHQPVTSQYSCYESDQPGQDIEDY